MSVFDFFANPVSCPACGEPGAWRFLWMVRCANMACPHFYRETMQQVQVQQLRLQPRSRSSRAAARASAQPAFGTSAIKDNVTIQYKNFRGEDKSFVGDAATARRRGNHISLCVQPTGKRIALNRDRITNLDQVERMIPLPVERHIISYHRLRQSSSPRYEEILRKYPHLA